MGSTAYGKMFRSGIAESLALLLRITPPRSSISTRPPVVCVAPAGIAPGPWTGAGAVESALYWNVARTFPFANRVYVCGWLNPARSPNEVRIFGSRGTERS